MYKSAVGHNPISVIIPCHRVVGANGNLTGYAGGTERKRSCSRSNTALCAYKKICTSKVCPTFGVHIVYGSF